MRPPSASVDQILVAAERFLVSKNPSKCVELCSEALKVTPGHYRARYIRGIAYYESKNYQLSAGDLQAVARALPDNLGTAYYLGRTLRMLGRFDEAIHELERSTAYDKVEIGARFELALHFSMVRREADAMMQYRKVLELDPNHKAAASNYAALLEQANEIEEAEFWVGRVLSADPDFVKAQQLEAILSLRKGNLDEAIEQFERNARSAGTKKDQVEAYHHLGKCFDRKEDWGNAFKNFHMANQIQLDYHPHAKPDMANFCNLQGVATIRQWLNEKPMRDWTISSDDQLPGVTFLVGFPRSGTTLLNRILASHPDIQSLDEKNLFNRIHRDWTQKAELDRLADLNNDQIRKARSIYRENLAAANIKPGKTLIVDKMPLNLVNLFLIYRIFPEAPIIFSLRHPLDSCLSCFIELFALRDKGAMQNFLDLTQTALYYDRVMDVATESMAQIGNPIHNLRYEDLIMDFESRARRLISFLGIDWADKVLSYLDVQDDQMINTPSYRQVVQPMYTRSIGRWRNYEEQLEPIKSLLGPWIKHFGYGEDISAGINNEQGL